MTRYGRNDATTYYAMLSEGVSNMRIARIARRLNFGLLVIGLLAGWAITKAVYELGYQTTGICGECLRKLP